MSIHVGDVGTLIQVTVLRSSGSPFDVSAMDIRQFIFKSPTSHFHRTAAMTSDGSDGKLEYLLQAGDIDINGKWKLEVFLGGTSGSWTCDVINMPVSKNVDPEEVV